MIFVVPDVNPVTTPALLTEATAAFVLLHGVVAVTAAGVPLPVSVIVPPIQTALEAPVIVGSAETVTVSLD